MTAGRRQPRCQRCSAAALPMADWHPATWVFAALAAHALFARGGNNLP